MRTKIIYDREDCTVDEFNDGTVRVTLFNEENHWDGDVQFKKEEWVNIIKKTMPKEIIEDVVSKFRNCVLQAEDFIDPSFAIEDIYKLYKEA